MSSGDSARCSHAEARLTLMYSFLYRVHQLTIGPYPFLFSLQKNVCKGDPMSGSAKLAQCVLRKRKSVSTPCSWDSHPGLHPIDGGFCSPSLVVPQVLVHIDTVRVTWFPQHSAEHVWRVRNTCRLLHPIQENVKIVFQHLLSCVSENFPHFQNKQQSVPLTSLYVS